MAATAQRSSAQVAAILADHSPGGTHTAGVSCNHCHEAVNLTTRERLSDAQVAARLGDLGWTFAGYAAWLCPDCTHDPQTSQEQQGPGTQGDG